jgi:hypothetical protein
MTKGTGNIKGRFILIMKSVDWKMMRKKKLY